MNIDLQNNVSTELIVTETPPPGVVPHRGNDWKYRLRPWALLLPGGLFLGILILASLMIFRMSFGLKGAEWSTWTLQNYVDVGQSIYLKSIVTTFKLSFLATILVVVMGYPIAMFMARTSSNRVRLAVTFILLLPLFVNLLFQSYGWMLILSPSGLLIRLLLYFGVIERPITLMFNQSGVLLGLIQTSISLGVLPIASALRGIPKSLEEAGATLGAKRFWVFWHIIFPLSLPGVIAGSLLVFAFNVSAFVIPMLLGGRRVTMLTLLIRDQMGPMLNWPLGAAIATVLVVITLLVLSGYQIFITRYMNPE